MNARSRPTITRHRLVSVTVVAATALAVLIPAASSVGATSPTAQIKNCKRRYASKGRKKHLAEARCEKTVREAGARRRGAKHSSSPLPTTSGPSGSAGGSAGGGGPSASPPSGPSSPVEEPAPPASPPAPPDTVIDSGPPATVAPTETEAVTFHATGSSSGFECRVGTAGFEPCSSSWSFEVGSAGEYAGQVRAVGEGGADPTPASFDFRSAPPIKRCGTLVHDETWSTQEISGVILTCPLEIPAGVALAIGPGVFVKAGNDSEECERFDPCSLDVQGTLDAVGTESAPITFTSVNDDSIGGDGGDGTPAAGDWAGIATTGEGSIDLEHARIDFAAVGVQAFGNGPTTITHNSLSTLERGAVEIEPLLSGVSAPTLSDNTAVNSEEVNHRHELPAFAVATESLDPELLRGNDATGSGRQVVTISGTVSTDSTLGDEPIPWALDAQSTRQVGGSSFLAVPAGTTLTIAPGTVIKAQGRGGGEQGFCDRSIYCQISVQGTLDAVGTESAPITFTSLEDDSVGGQSGDNTPAAGDWAGIASTGEGSLDIEHVRIDYAAVGVQAFGSGPTTISHDSLSTLERSAVEIEPLLSGAPAPTLADNAAANSEEVNHRHELPAFAVAAESLDLDLLTGNDATGSGRQVVAINGTIGTDSTLGDEPIPWALDAQTTRGVGTAEFLTVPQGRTLTIAPGTVIKAEGGGGGEQGFCDRTVYCLLSVQGTLEAVGTEAAPITFTSLEDDSIGGQSGENKPAAGDWAGIGVDGEGTLDLEHARIDYATVGVQASDESHATVRVSFSDDTTDVRACEWGAECAVDAAYVDWGEAGAPTTPATVCGAVTTSPYLSGDAALETGVLPKNCDNSPSPWEALAEEQMKFNESVATAEDECSGLGDGTCEAIQTAFGCLSGAWDLANSRLPFQVPNPFSGGEADPGSIWKQGASTMGEAGAKWLSDSADPSVASVGGVASRGFDILGIASTFLSPKSAYESCSP